VAYEQLGERTGYVPGGVNVGVVRGDSGAVILIDAGINETNGKKVLKSVREELGAEVQAIVTTHGHADHFGANAAVVKRSGAKVYAPEIDEIFLRYPIMQPSMLFGGADPIESLRTPFMLAHASPVDVVYGNGGLEIDGVTLEVIDLGGHSPGQKGILVDGVFFCADVVLPASVLEKYRIPYLYSVTDHLKALEMAGTIEHSIAMPGHGAVRPDLPVAIDENRQLVEQVIEAIVDHLAEPRSTEETLAEVFARFNAPITDAPGFYLLQPTIAGFLSHLERAGAITNEIVDRRSLWRRI
jgi:glyoxylase-like metal-dependent hydrolase (beta-lactamase superfamily II)